ncbi:exosome complex component RRP40 [Daktulosphaira vitifoliae]|uniref:exosome complex component RRP40 n=1 Tax=Daktulosphaira vitifoliae TaxID=58002 RepID=UPI0021AAA747|nr:exosome complex component RRP40 [Daktulosphaira vitifoliae]
MTTLDSFNYAVLPGNDLSKIILKGDTSCKKSEKIIGPGLNYCDNNIFVNNSGILKNKQGKFYWVEHQKRKYTPSKDDIVVGVVVAKTSEMYKVDIGSTESATLPYLAFTNATKKNRPDIKIGNVLAARIKVTTPYMEPEISCVEYANSVILGQLENGFLIKVSINYALKLKMSDNTLLYQLGKYVPYEIVIGINGRIWIKTATVQTTIAIVNTIINAEHTIDEDIPNLIKIFEKNLTL